MQFVLDVTRLYTSSFIQCPQIIIHNWYVILRTSSFCSGMYNGSVET